MALIDDLSALMEEVLSTKWNVRDGKLVPESEDLSLKDGAVKIEATFLYADLAGSSKLATLCPWQTTAKIVRAYLDCCTRLIRHHGGEIRSFDGDRVMGIFKGTTPNKNATTCAREIDWMVEEVLNPKASAKFKSIQNAGMKITHCIGIDTGEAVAVRAGIRNNSDLIWIGRAPSFAAKLSDIRTYPHSIYISDATYKKITANNIRGTDEDIWVKKTVKFAGEDETVYSTRYMSRP